MDRRQFLKLGGAAAAAGTMAPAVAETIDPRATPKRIIRSGRIDMTIASWENPVIDGNLVYATFFKIEGSTRYPVIYVMEGETLEIVLRNNDDQPHAFAVTGVSIPYDLIPPGGYAKYTFAAPPPGSYIYYDPHNDPVNRILGLHGALVVLPLAGTKTPMGSPIPYNYAQQNKQVCALFDELGAPDGIFPGNKWDPDPSPYEKYPRDLVWVTSEMDSTLARRIADGDEVSGSVWKSSFTPDYFTINGVSGFETAGHGPLDDEKYSYTGLIEPKGYEGQPTLIRCLNAGLATHSLHIHGNDIYELTGTNAAGAVVVRKNIFALDVWGMPPMERKDMLLPFVRPLDAAVWPPVEEPFPMRYVMHCHCEMSNTAGGGNYPQGMVTHWEMIGTYKKYKEMKGLL